MEQGQFHRTSPISRRPHLPTVDQAFQYTPLTSIIPFDSSIIPYPLAAPPSLPRLSAGREETDYAEQIFMYLNHESQNCHDPSGSFNHTLRDLQSLLRSENLTSYTLKNSPQVSATTTLLDVNGQAHHQNGPTQHRQSEGLGAFASLLLNSTDVDYQVSVLNHHNPAKRDFKDLAQSPGTPALKPTPRSPGHQFPSSQDSGNGLQVVVPFTPSTNRSEYRTLPELDAAVMSEGSRPAKKRKIDHGSPAEGPHESGVDQQQKANAALSTLQDVISTIFEAEDNLEPDTSGNLPHECKTVFTLVEHGEGRSHLISPEIQTRLDSAISKVVTSRKFDEIPIEDLSRLQRRCHSVVTVSANLEVCLPEADDEDSINSLVRRAEIAESSLRSSKIILKIFTAGRQEKQIYSEEILQDLLSNLRQILDGLVVPVTELRAASSLHGCLRADAASGVALNMLTQRTGQVLKLLSDLVLKVDISESAINLIESIAAGLIFVENASTDRESILGPSKFEGLRRRAMDVLARVFLRSPSQRRSIFQEILTSLEKLPVTRQNARQFKIPDAKPVQLVSALIMQLIQTSATNMETPKRHKLEGSAQSDDEEQEMSDDSDYSGAETSSMNKKQRQHALKLPKGSPMEQLKSVGKPLYDSAQSHASFVANYLVQRAMTSTKTGDQPYRVLLDIFTEDFINVLGSTDWPAAELLLAAILSQLFRIMDREKSPAPAKNMALDLMGVMGSGIADLRSQMQRLSRTYEPADNTPAQNLPEVCEEILDNRDVEIEVLALDGPFRAAFEYLQYRGTEDLQLQSARDLLLCQWAKCSWQCCETPIKDVEDTRPLHQLGDVAGWLASAMQHPSSIEADNQFGMVPTSTGRLSYVAAIMTMPFCKAMQRIIVILVASLTSPHATVRSRSLKSVVQLLEKDPSILDRVKNALGFIVRASGDPSTMVRDSALGLLGKCLALKPSLEPEVLRTIVARTSDAAIGVRKRALKLLRDVYLRTKRDECRTAIADTFLKRVSDEEETVAEMALQSLEEIWMAPFYDYVANAQSSLQSRQSMRSHALQIAGTAKHADSVFKAMKPAFENFLSDLSKNRAANRSVCNELVSILFDQIIENQQSSDKSARQGILQLLTIFASARPRLFTSDQMWTLRPYIQNLSSNDDLIMYRSVLIIYRHVLPALPPLQHDFLHSVQHTLLSTTSRLPKLELGEAATCLAIIDGVLNNTDRLVKLLLSVLRAIDGSRSTNFHDDSQSASLARTKRYLRIAGSFGRACNFEAHLSSFSQDFSWWKGNSVSSLITDIVSYYALESQPLSLRETALESLCEVCQSWPKNYLKAEVAGKIESALQSHSRSLENVILSGFHAFYMQEEARAKLKPGAAEEDSNATGAERLGKSMLSSDNDGAATSLAQQYFHYILNIALSAVSELALTAVEVLISINRQGLVHPRECGPTLVALETSPNKVISRIAYEEHKTLNSKHESILEKEYLKAVDQAFAYQRDIVHRTSGVNRDQSPKLHLFFEVLRNGSASVRKKILGNIAKRLNFSMAKAYEKDMEQHLLYTRFVCQNLALAEYARIDDILSVISVLSSVFATTGDALAQELERFFGGVAQGNAETGEKEDDAHQPKQASLPSGASQTTGPARLKRLAMAACVLLAIWQTRSHLRSTWSLQSLLSKSGGNGKTKVHIKDASKAPIRSTNTSALVENFVKISENVDTHGSEQQMMDKCREFMELHSTDTEAKVAADEDAEGNDGMDMDDSRFQTPSADEGYMEESVHGSVGGSGKGGRGRRRTSTPANGGTPAKRGRGRPSLGKRKSSGGKISRDSDDDEHGGWD